MTEEVEQKFIKPIVNASYPGTLAALSLAALQVTGGRVILPVKLALSLGALMFLLSSFSLFFYDIYPTKRWIWTSAALSFLAGLSCSVLAVLVLLLV